MEPLDLDLNKLTLGELEDLEDTIGRPLEEIFPDAASFADDGTPLGPDGLPLVMRVPKKVFTAFVWILKKRDDPTLTLDAVRAMKLVDIAGAAPTAGPTTRVAKNGAKSAARRGR